MSEWGERAQNILNTPAKTFTISGIADDGSLIDLVLSFNQVKSLTDNIPRDLWVYVPNYDFWKYGINSNSAAVKFNRQTLMSMKNKNAFIDCIWIESKIRDSSTNKIDWKIRYDLLDKIEKRLFS